ncbi:MAG: hypothetical protein OEM52_00835 [bacterium]|nr:hypothetical protein [bacterium]
MILAAKRLAPRLIAMAAIVVVMAQAGAASGLRATWIDRTFAQAKSIHVQKEMVRLTAELQLREAFLQTMIDGSRSEIQARKRSGGDVPNFTWPTSEVADFWVFRDTLNLLKSFEDYKATRVSDYDSRLEAVRKLKRDLIATASPLDIVRMRMRDWQSFERSYGADVDKASDPELALMLSDEYGRNYPTALADSFWFYRAEIALAGGYYDEAILAYNRVVIQEASRYRPEVFNRLAFIYAELGDLAGLESNWLQWINAGRPFAKEGRVQFHTGRARYIAGGYSTAISALNEVPSSSDYYERARLLLGSSYGLNQQFDSAMTALSPILSKKLDKRLQINADLKRYATLKYAQLQNFSGRSREALQTIEGLDTRSEYGDQVLFTRAWIYRSMSKYSDMSMELDTLVRRAAWSPFVPLANAWLAEVTEIRSGQVEAVPMFEHILGMLEQRQQISDYTEERYQLYHLLNSLNTLETELLLENDIGVFAKYIDQRRRLLLMIEQNKNGASLAANPALKELYQEEIATSQLAQNLVNMSRSVDRQNKPSQLKKYFELTEKQEKLSARLGDLMMVAQGLTPAIQREQDVLAFNRRLKELGKSSRDLLSQSRPDAPFQTVDRAAFTTMKLDKLGTRILTAQLDKISTDIDRYANFAMTRYALGGFDFDLLDRKRDRSDELTFYIKRLETLMEEKAEQAEEAAASAALLEMMKTATPDSSSAQPAVVPPEQK